MKTCGYCAEEIQDEAIKCRHCGEFLDGGGMLSEKTPTVIGPTFESSARAPMRAAAFAQPKTNGSAVAALVLGIVWMGGVGSVLALVFGYSGKAQIDRSQGQETGRGMAVAGIVLGWIGVGSVLTVVALLIAGPNVANKAKDSAFADEAHSVLRNADAAARICFTDVDSFDGCTASKLATIEPNLTFVDTPTPSTDPETVSVGVAGGGQTWSGAVMAGDGTCYVITDDGSQPVITGTVASTGGCPNGSGGGYVSSAAAIAKVTSVPASTLEQIGIPSGQQVPALPVSVPPVVSGGKPVVTYAGAEYCPYCAAERWPLVVALSRFGTFSNLGTTTSAPEPEPFPDTPTLTFHDSSYSSDYLVLSAVETETNTPDATTGGWTRLDIPTAQQQQLLTTYDTQQYTGSDGGIPFVMIGNLYAWAGATYDPTVLEGLTFDQIANQLENPNSKVAQGVDGAANKITAMICRLTGNQPSDVCSAPFI